MRQGSIRLGRVLGIPVSMDLGVLLVGGFLTWSLATFILPNGAPGFVAAVYWTVAIIGSLVFLGSLLVHELAHSVVARRNDVGVEGITLWLFGGYAQFDSEPRTPGAEFRITAAGPASSLALGLVFGGAAVGLNAIGGPAVYTILLAWLALINGALGLFNLLPGAPLDGGRILAAALWKLRGDRVSGRIGAARTGQVIGAGLIVLGVVDVALLGGMSGIWTVLIGWFLFGAARSEVAHFVGEQALDGLTVGEVMAPTPQVVKSWTSIADLVEGPLRNTHRSAIAVTDWSGRAIAVVTMADVRRVPADSWSTTEVGQIADQRSLIGAAAPDEKLLGLMQRLAERSGEYAVVEHDGYPIGLVGPDEVRHAIERGRSRNVRPKSARSTTDRRGRRRNTPPPAPSGSGVPTQRWEPPVVTH